MSAAAARGGAVAGAGMGGVEAVDEYAAVSAVASTIHAPNLSSSPKAKPKTPVSRVSKTLAVLQDLANEIALEDSLSGEFALINAANEVAIETGMLHSPSKRKERERSQSQEGANSPNSNKTGQSGSNESGLPKDNAAPEFLSTEEVDVDALFAKMNFTPKSVEEDVGSIDMADDIAALLKMGGIKDPDKQKNTQSLLKDRYLQNLKKRDNTRSKSSGRLRSSYDKPKTLISKISDLIDAADDKIIDKLRASNTFSSSTQEMLLRNMHTMKKKNAAQGRPNKGGPDEEDNKSFKEEKEVKSVASSVVSRLSTSYKQLYESDSKKKAKNIRMSTERLSRPASAGHSRRDEVRGDPKKQFARFDEAKECTFRPNLRTGSNRKSRDDNDVKPHKYIDDFIIKQENEFWMHREKLKEMREKADYDALLDKKVCPRCHSVQSYDEVCDKRKYCPNCKNIGIEVEYRRKVAWNEVSKGFYNKDKKFATRRTENREKIARQVEEESRFVITKVQKKICPDCDEWQESFPTDEDGQLPPICPHCRVKFRSKIVQLTETRKQPKQRLDSDEERELYDRMYQKQLERQNNLQEIERRVMEEKCPFKPTLNLKQKKSLRDEDGLDADYFSDEFGGENDNGNKVRQFLSRVDEDLERRKDSHPERFELPPHTQKMIQERESKRVLGGSFGASAPSYEDTYTGSASYW